MIGRVVSLVPGLNLVDSEDLAKLRENKSFDLNFKETIKDNNSPEMDRTRVGRPILEVVKTIGKNGEVDDRSPLAKLDAVQCATLIGETLSEDLLKSWMGEETRHEVRGVIQKRIDALTTGEEIGGGATSKKK
jgi:hypothetical protein